MIRKRFILGLFVGVLVVLAIAATPAFQPNRNIDATGYNITAGLFFGNGSQLTGITGSGTTNQSGITTGYAVNVSGQNYFQIGDGYNGSEHVRWAKQVNLSSSFAGTLNLSHLDTSSAANSEVVTYNSTSGEAEWQPASSSGGAWTHVQTFSLTQATAEQLYSVSSSYDYYKVCIYVLKGTSAVNSGLGVRFNGITSGYKQNYIVYSTAANPNSNAFYLNADLETGTSNIGGCGMFNRLEVNNENTMFTGSFYSGDQEVWWGGRVDAGGAITSITFDDYTSNANFTGVIDIWGLAVP